MSRIELGDLSGVSYQTVGKWEREDKDGGTAPKRDRLPVVAAVLKVTETWLLTGNSDTVEPDRTTSKYVFIRPYHSPSHLETARLKRHYEISALSDDEQDSYAYRIDWMKKHGFEADDCVVVLAKDNAMNLGEQCLVDTSKRAIVDAQPYALDGPAGVRLRRLFMRFDGKVILRADNPTYPEEVAAPGDLHIVGRVVAFQGALP